MIRPPKLEKGDTIGVIAPSEAVLETRGLKKSIAILKAKGFKIKLSRNFYKKHGDYMAGTAEERVADFHQMFKDKKIKAIMCYSGGSSANQLLPLLNYRLIQKNPKIFIGYSDVSTLTNAIYQQTGLVTFHGPHVGGGKSTGQKYTIDNLFKLLMNPRPFGILKPLTKWHVLKIGKSQAHGRLAGGNLEIIHNLIGTKFLPRYHSFLQPWQKTIFFWEEINEQPHDIHQILMHYKLAGIFDRLAGMLVGKLVNCKEKSYRHSLSIGEIILEVTQGYNFPIITDVDFGHINTVLTLPIGAKTIIKTHPLQIIIEDPAVK